MTYSQYNSIPIICMMNTRIVVMCQKGPVQYCPGECMLIFSFSNRFAPKNSFLAHLAQLVPPIYIHSIPPTNNTCRPVNMCSIKDKY